MAKRAYLAGMTMTDTQSPVGILLRDWRQRRRYSQLDLACEAEISQRHLSFLESGKAQPSREMILHLCDHLDIPLRERNELLLAAGFAPIYPEHALQGPQMANIHDAIRMILAGHEPHPAIVVDRSWHLVAANATAHVFMTGVDATLLVPPVNMIRLSLHPGGLAPRILNLTDWRAHILERLRRQLRLSGDATLASLIEEIAGYPLGDRGTSSRPAAVAEPSDLFMPLRYRSDLGDISLLATTTVFGTASEVTLSELTLEAFYPADQQTAAIIRSLGTTRAG